jgi:lipoyl(octanoyl) transferase
VPQPSSGDLDCEAPISSKTLPPAGRERKIAAIGIHVARGVTSHGFAFNVTTNLGDFALINPCGITDRSVTSLEREVAEPGSLPNLEFLAHRAARHFGEVFNEPVALVESIAALRTQAGAHSDSRDPDSPAPEVPAPEFPAQDTPLQIPPEIERLRPRKDRPVSA